MTQEQFIDKAVDWLKENYHDFWGYVEYNEDPTEMFDLFRKDMAVKESLTTAWKQVWHKASEELPKENKTVLGVGISGHNYVCRYMYGHWYSESNLTARIIITHWMPIPELPNED